MCYKQTFFEEDNDFINYTIGKKVFSLTLLVISFQSYTEQL